MKKLLTVSTALLALLMFNGCVSGSPEHYEELTAEEHASLVNSAKVLILQSKLVPAHLQQSFVRISPQERIIYNGDKHGKASLRWEIYENRPRSGQKITQKDINPYWITAQATGNLLNPQWQVSQAQSMVPQKLAPGQSRNGGRQVRSVRYKSGGSR